MVDNILDDWFGIDPFTPNDQADANVINAEAMLPYNFIGQNTPYGSTSYAKDPNTGFYSQQYSESPFMQFLRQGAEDQTANIMGLQQNAIGNLPNAPMNPDNYSPWGDTFSAGQGMNMNPQDYGQATYDYMMTLAQPGFEQSDMRFNQQLANQGIDPTSEYGRRMSTMYGDQRMRDLQQMQNAALQQSLGAQQQMFGQSVDEGNFDNKLRLSQFAEDQGLRNQQYGELANLFGMQPINPIQPQAPGFFAPGSVGGGAAYGGNNASMNQMQSGSALGGLFNVGTSIYDLVK